jgi:two-component system, sensor histidine kinase and response regulator
VALTASVFQEQQAKILDIGCNDLVCKPYQEQQIFEKIAQYLGVEYLYEALDLHDDQMLDAVVESDLQEAERLLALSPTWIDALRQAALAVDADQVRSLIQDIQPTQSRLANQLMSLLNQYDFDPIIDLAESLKSSLASTHTG